MTDTIAAYLGARIFDGRRFHDDCALLVRGTAMAGVVPAVEVPPAAQIRHFAGGTLAPGYVDLQVNGGGGVMFNDAPSVQTLRTMAEAHARIGATAILPTLITDTPDRTRAAIDAVEGAVRAGIAGILGLHLEGPHLSLARKGAHDPGLIRPMTAADLELLIAAAGRLPALMVTLAPESVSLDQIRMLARSGVTVSLGHTDASFATCREATEAGVSCVTHLFNAMSQLQNREPGLVGAALSLGTLSAGLIADAVHVHPQAMATALRAKQGPGALYLVSDAMATAGSDIAGFYLNGRWIARCDNRLTLADGTLAGAHLDLTTAIRNLVDLAGAAPEQAFAMATSVPATLIGQAPAYGHLAAGARADFVHLSRDQTLSQVWQNGEALNPDMAPIR